MTPCTQKLNAQKQKHFTKWGRAYCAESMYLRLSTAQGCQTSQSFRSERRRCWITTIWRDKSPKGVQWWDGRGRKPLLIHTAFTTPRLIYLLLVVAPCSCIDSPRVILLSCLALVSTRLYPLALAHLLPLKCHSLRVSHAACHVWSPISRARVWSCRVKRLKLTWPYLISDGALRSADTVSMYSLWRFHAQLSFVA